MIFFPSQWFGTRLRWCSVATGTIAIRQDPRLSPSGRWAAKVPWRRVRCGAVCHVTSFAMGHRFGTFPALAPVNWLPASISYRHWCANFILIATDRWWCWPSIRKVLPLVRSNQDECVGKPEFAGSVSTGTANEGNLKYCTAYRWHKCSSQISIVELLLFIRAEYCRLLARCHCVTRLCWRLCGRPIVTCPICLPPQKDVTKSDSLLVPVVVGAPIFYWTMSCRITLR